MLRIRNYATAVLLTMARGMILGGIALVLAFGLWRINPQAVEDNQWLWVPIIAIAMLVVVIARITGRKLRLI